MPPAIRKPAVKKAPAKAAENPVFQMEAKAFYGTKGTVRLNETGDSEGHLIGSLYLKKEALGDVQPTHIRVTVEVLEQGPAPEKKTK